MRKFIKVFLMAILLSPGYAAAGVWTELDIPGTTTTWLSGIDGSDIIGFSSNNNYSSLYDGTSWTTINVPGSMNTRALGIDGDNIVGTCAVFDVVKGGYDNFGFLYNGTTYTTFSAPTNILPPLVSRTSAFDMDGDTIVGAYDSISDIGRLSHGFIFDGTSWTTLNFPGAFHTSAVGISGNSVIGLYQLAQYEMDDEDTYGFLYDGTDYTSLNFPDAFRTHPEGIDGSNIVGHYTDSFGGLHGFLYDGTTWTTLDAPETWGTTILTGIDGSTIVGNIGSGASGLVYTTPEPATLLLLGFGGLLLRKRK